MPRQTFRAEVGGRRTGFDVGAAGALPGLTRQPRTEIGLPRTPAASPARPLDFSAIQTALQSWQRLVIARQQQAAEQRREEEVRESRQEAARLQIETGVSALVDVPEDLMDHQRQAFEAQAKATYTQQVKTAATQRAVQLQLENPNNPEAFQSAWEAYRASTVGELMDRDAVFASEIDTYLEAVGARGATSLMEQSHASELEQRKARVLTGFYENLAAAGNAVRDEPTQYTLAEYTSEVLTGLSDLADAGLLSGTEVMRLEAQVKEDLTRNHIAGLANQALQSEDDDALQLLADNLRTGRYFDDNRIGDTLAAGVERQANAIRTERQRELDRAGRERDRLLREGNALIKAGERRKLGELSSIVQSVVEGNPLTPERQERATELGRVLLSALDEDVGMQAQQMLAGMAVVTKFNERMDEMSPMQIQAYAEGLSTPEAISALPSSIRNAVGDMLRSELGRIANAQADNDRAAAGLRGYNNIPVEQLAPEVIEENRELAAQRLGVDLHLMPYYTNDQIRGAASNMREAARRGDTVGYNAMLEKYLQPYAQSESEVAGLFDLMSADEEVGSAALLAYYTSTPDMAATARAEMFTSTMSGFDADGPTIRLADLSSDARDVLFAMSETNGAKMSSLMTGIQAMGRGQVLTGQVDRPDSLQVGRRVSELLTQVPTKRFSNGVMIPAIELGHTSEVRRVRTEAIEEVLRDQGVRAMFDAPNLRPVPLPDGGYAFRNKATGVFARGTDGQMVTASVSGPRIIEAAEADEAQMQRDLEAARLEYIGALDLGEQPRQQFVEYGSSVGVAEEDALALFRAISLSPAKSLSRMPSGVAPEVLREGFLSEQTPYMSDARRFLVQSPGPTFSHVSQQDVGRLATLGLYAEHLEVFDGDRAKAMAAIAAGRHEVHAAIEFGGSAWLDAMEDDVQNFVYKGLRR